MSEPNIQQLEETYQEQMAEIRAAVLHFAESKGWQRMSRGRRAHVSIFGIVNNLDGLIDVIMEETDWHLMPERLQPDTPFDLFCTAGINVSGDARRYADTILFWQAPFSILPEAVDRFLPVAWEMLSGMGEANLLEDWYGPHENPHLPPDFGPPQLVRP